ncbi:MAG: hypothetical protein WD426_16940 [Anditalea sp.]
MGNIKGFIYSFLLLVVSHFAQAQELKVEGYFLQDSAMLGEKVGYVLKATYPPEINVLFPDSTFQFGSMEYLGKETFTSFTEDSLTLDSAIYYLSNFSLDPIKKYKLPVFEILRYDSISHLPEEGLLHLKLTIDEMPDELAFKETNRYQPIKKDFNYPYLIIGLSLVFISSLLLFLIFGKKAKISWLIYLEKKKQKKFLTRWDKVKTAFITNPSLEAADELLGLWKSRMEALTNKPFKEWTATETAIYLEMPEILQDFRKIELIIYADRPAEDVQQACDNLEKINTATFHQKIKAYHEHE